MATLKHIATIPIHLPDGGTRPAAFANRVTGTCCALAADHYFPNSGGPPYPRPIYRRWS